MLSPAAQQLRKQNGQLRAALAVIAASTPCLMPGCSQSRPLCPQMLAHKTLINVQVLHDLPGTALSDN